MSSGSSNIDPNEFNEDTPDENAAENEATTPEGESAQRTRRAQRESARRRSINRRRRRRRRRRLRQPPNEVMLRIWIYSQENARPMTRQYMNRIMFSVGRCLRTQSSLPAQPGRAIPAIIFRRSGNLAVIDVEREPSP